MRQLRTSDRAIAGTADAGAMPAVGKSTLTEALGPGESLPADHRARFESSLGRDLSQVRVHTDDHASRLADIFGSRAFASGGNIAFAKGEYDPKSRDGAHLLAHDNEIGNDQRHGDPAKAQAVIAP